jgi:hypothetical protein
VGVEARRVKGYYDCLVASEGELEDSRCSDPLASEGVNEKTEVFAEISSEKCKGQIEKVNVCLHCHGEVLSFSLIINIWES